MYAIMPDDGMDGFLVGDMCEVINLWTALDRLIKESIHDGVISHLDERLGWAWLTVHEASEQENIPERTIAHACAQGYIGAAQKDETGRWRFPSATFRGWVVNRPKPGPKPTPAPMEDG
jgi:hypothetical protein